jgi:hypothetical protein
MSFVSCVDEYFLPEGSCTGNISVFWASLLFFIILIIFTLIVGPAKNIVDYGAHIYAFSNIFATNSPSCLSLRLYALFFVFDHPFEQLLILFLATIGIILSIFDEETVVTYYVCVTSITTVYYFFKKTKKQVGVFLLIDCGVAISSAFIILNDIAYANYIVIIASSLPRILIYGYREFKKIITLKNKFVTESFIDRLRLASYILSWVFIVTVFTYPLRLFGVLIKPSFTHYPKYFYSILFVEIVILLILASNGLQLVCLITYGVLVPFTLLYRDLKNKKDYALYFLEFFCFWVVCVPLYFETTYFPLLFFITSIYGVVVSAVGVYKFSKITSWENAEYGLHFFDSCGKTFTLTFGLIMLGFGLWLGFLYGYVFFSNLIGRFISF